MSSSKSTARLYSMACRRLAARQERERVQRRQGLKRGSQDGVWRTLQQEKMRKLPPPQPLSASAATWPDGPIKVYRWSNKRNVSELEMMVIF